MYCHCRLYVHANCVLHYFHPVRIVNATRVFISRHILYQLCHEFEFLLLCDIEFQRLIASTPLKHRASAPPCLKAPRRPPFDLFQATMIHNLRALVDLSLCAIALGNSALIRIPSHRFPQFEFSHYHNFEI